MMKPLPSCPELETEVLGELLTFESAAITVFPLLTEQMFYSEQNRKIFRTMRQLWENSEPIDILTVTNKIFPNMSEQRKLLIFELGNAQYSISSSVAIQTHCLIIIQHFLAREGIFMSEEFSNKLYAGSDVLDTFEDHMVDLLKVYSVTNLQQATKVGSIVTESIALIDKIRSKEISMVGIPSMLDSIDTVINGLQAPDLIIIAARPSMGKTALALTMARSVGFLQKIPCAIFSLEMSKRQLANRLICMETGIDYWHLVSGGMTAMQYASVKSTEALYQKSPIYIDDTAGLDIQKFRAKATELKLKHGIKAIFVDYIQLMSGKGENRTTEVSSISRGLKIVAKELDVPVIALSQLSRKAEERGDKRPMLSDLRESGSIEQDADIVMLMYRPDYYKIYTDSDKNMLPDGYTEIDIGKNRNGRTGMRPLRFLPDVMQFEDLDLKHNSYERDLPNDIRQNDAKNSDFF